MTPQIPEILTSRLKLRAWRESDLTPFAELNADPVVMTYFPELFTRERSDAQAAGFTRHLQQHGVGFWAVEILGGAPFIGFVGMQHVDFDAPFVPAVETGWRLAKEFWNQGYASEAAQAVQDYAFQQLAIPELVAFTAVRNATSRRVMEKVGMVHSEQENFGHPGVGDESPLKEHVLYRISNPSGTP